MAGLEGGSKRGKARGGGAIPRVTESGGMWRRQPASRACRALLSFQPASPLPKMLSWKRQGELRPFLPLTLPLVGGSGHVSRAFGVEAQLAPAPQSPGSAFRAAPWVPALGRWRETWCCGPRTSAKGCREWGGGVIRMRKGSQDRGRGQSPATPSHFGPAHQVSNPPGLGTVSQPEARKVRDHARASPTSTSL